jgi:hypothetical protein
VERQSGVAVRSRTGLRTWIVAGVLVGVDAKIADWPALIWLGRFSGPRWPHVHHRGRAWVIG